ncbi:2'-5' RNA ligase family protein [Planotetraspora sp. A-T 1434]|uniref:2'-5' RNA ligase family protein n=1 Tax=Planotetraspora sp. A-T 1434 TaxID=2979219 RepID=UPI0021C21290|nr:2'-5' RNA ligase family protein [Planotetraspora sp. A-T 1434]MCT9929137.1 2'-5' RNA ligase family protein [Planotetraspora sp. A-T 1434]
MTAQTPREKAETERRRRVVRELTHMRDHWEWRKGWRYGRRAYWWYIPLGGYAEVARLSDVSHQSLSLPVLDRPAARNLHISVQQVGFSDEVERAEVDEIVGKVRARLGEFGPLPLRLGPMDPDPEAVVLRVTPWREISALRIELRRAIEQVIGDDRLVGTDDHFWPHVTIGYCNAVTPTAPILAALEAQPYETTVEIVVGEIHMVSLGRDHREWCWDVVDTVRLGQ